jgi:hypothetical protein
VVRFAHSLVDNHERDALCLRNRSEGVSTEAFQAADSLFRGADNLIDTYRCFKTAKEVWDALEIQFGSFIAVWSCTPWNSS